MKISIRELKRIVRQCVNEAKIPSPKSTYMSWFRHEVGPRSALEAVDVMLKSEMITRQEAKELRNIVNRGYPDDVDYADARRILRGVK